MTEKELKKLSRVELFEILLEESKENERLRQELLQKNEELSANADINSLIAADRMNTAIEKLDLLVSKLETNVEKSKAQKDTVKETSVADEAARNAAISDRKLFLRLLSFYSSSKIAMALLPSEIQNDVKARLRGITDARK